MTLSFQRASELVQQTGGDMTQEQMDEFEFLTGGFSLEEAQQDEKDLRSVIFLAQSSPTAKINKGK
tara:strand:+ start:74 stop:271 length:198 start_codon:yes stop_codon:yes gene_type:complete